jgi:hypothetical protein
MGVSQLNAGSAAAASVSGERPIPTFGHALKSGAAAQKKSLNAERS